MGLWDDEVFMDKHADEWREDAYCDRHGCSESEDVSRFLEPSTQALLLALDNASEEFFDCLYLTRIYDYLVNLYEYFNGKKYTVSEAQNDLSDVEYAKNIRSQLPEFISAVDDTINNAPNFSDKFCLEDMKAYAEDGMEELQTIINNGGID